MTTANREISPPLQPVPLTYWSMEKALRYVSSHLFLYQPIYGHPLPLLTRRCGPLLTFFMSVVHDADRELELAQQGALEFRGVDPWVERTGQLIALFHSLGVYDAFIQEKLDDTTKFWEIENQIMYANQASHALLMEAIRLVQGDFSVAHYLIHRILDIPLRPERAAAIEAFEIYVDLQANLIEYPGDMAEGTYNVYDVFIRLYGDAAAQHMQAELEKRKDAFQQAVQRLPAAEQTAFLEMHDRIGEYFYLYYLKTDGSYRIQHLALADNRFPTPIPFPEPVSKQKTEVCA